MHRPCQAELDVSFMPDRACSKKRVRLRTIFATFRKSTIICGAELCLAALKGIILGSAVLSLTESGESRGGGKSLCRLYEGIWYDTMI